MQSTVGVISRFLSRSLCSGVVNTKESFQSTNAVYNKNDRSRLVTAVSGYPKSCNDLVCNSNEIKPNHCGRVGEDAYFVASFIDHLLSNMSNDCDFSSPLQPKLKCNNNEQCSLRDISHERLLYPHMNDTSSSEVMKDKQKCYSMDVIGVADGVGGWRDYGIDPGQFSHKLMQNCLQIVRDGHFDPFNTHPVNILDKSFKEMLRKNSIVGSSTACLIMLSRSENKLYSANIGDSGFMVVRDGDIAIRSREQTHCFNTPFQLSVSPDGLEDGVLQDQPSTSDRYDFDVKDGDVILAATDGIFDNVPDSVLLKELSSLTSIQRKEMNNDSSFAETDFHSRESDQHLKNCLQQCSDSIASLAKRLSENQTFLSPFAKNARANGYKASGGKVDDITVLLAAVKIS